MRKLIKLTPINASLRIEIKLEECGDVYYRTAGLEEWKYSGYTIMESVHDYYIAKGRNRLDKIMQGTKRECLNAITDFIRTLFVSCQGK